MKGVGFLSSSTATVELGQICSEKVTAPKQIITTFPRSRPQHGFITVYARTSDELVDLGIRHLDASIINARIYRLERLNRGVESSVYTVFSMDRLMRNNDLSEINRVFESADVSQLTEWSMVALLRSTFSIRRHLPAWRLFYHKVNDKLTHDERPVKRLLFGLQRD